MEKPFTAAIANAAAATSLTGPIAYPNATLLAHHQSRHLTAQLYQWAAHLAPLIVEPVQQTQLIVQLAGAMHMSLARQGHQRRLLVQPGSVYLSAVHQPAYEMAWQGVTDQPITTVHVHLDNALLLKTAAEAGLNASRLEIRDDSGIDDPLLGELGRALVREITTQPAGHSLYADTVAQMLAGQLVHRHSTLSARAPRATGALRAEQLRRVRDYVQDQLASHITLEDLAGVACLSTYHFCRSFKLATGLTPYHYVQQQRIEQATRLLRLGRLSVRQVARQVGYQNAGHFAAVFQHITGQLPSAVLSQP